MPETTNNTESLVEQIRYAFTAHDLDAFGALLSDDVTWGDVNHPRGCRNRSDVMATFRRILNEGVDGSITSMESGNAGILCELHVEWPADVPGDVDRTLYHVYIVRDARICEIRRYDDRVSACEAAGLTP